MLIRRLGLVERGLVELRLADDRPGNALLRDIDRWLPRQHNLGERNGARQIVRRELVLGGARQHAGAFRMRGKRLAETHPGLDGAAMHIGARRDRQLFLLLLQRDQRGVARGRRARTRGILVGGALVLGRRFGILVALEQGLGQQIVAVAGVGIIREGRQQVAVPIRRYRVVLGLFRFLRVGVVVLREILEIGLELGHDLG